MAARWKEDKIIAVSLILDRRDSYIAVDFRHCGMERSFVWCDLLVERRARRRAPRPVDRMSARDKARLDLS